MTKTAWPAAEARSTADALIGMLSPFCGRIAIAGSLRRVCPEVGDIELVCISKQRLPEDLFGMLPSGGVSLLDEELERLITEGVLAFRLDSRGRKTFGPQNKYLIHVPSGISLDIFSTSTTNWGMTLFVRTGPKDFNIKVMSVLMARGMRGHAYGGITDANGHELPCPEEEDVFRVLGRPWIRPEDRT